MINRHHHPTPTRRITMHTYILRRTGVPLGAPGALRQMLRRSLGAGSWAGFWRHWNPLVGYGLARYVAAPLSRILPPALAHLLTFVVCGLLHDSVTMLVRGGPATLFTLWFSILGAVMLLGAAGRLTYAQHPLAVRVAVNLSYLGGCLGGALLLRAWLGLP